jgi:hypothetical protein
MSNSENENLVGAAEAELGRYIYRRIEALMDAKPGTPEADELGYLAHIAGSVEEYGEEHCGGSELAKFPAPPGGLQSGGEDESASSKSAASLASELTDQQPEHSTVWYDISSAPRDGQHILACKAGTSFGYYSGQPAPEVQTVVHWWGNPGEEGFYTSVGEVEPQNPFEATHWRPLERLRKPRRAPSARACASPICHIEGCCYFNCSAKTNAAVAVAGAEGEATCAGNLPPDEHSPLSPRERELLEALEPFASAALFVCQQTEDWFGVTPADFERARAALLKAKAGDPDQ